MILTAGGIYATVREVREPDLDVEISPGTIVRLDKRAIAIVVEPVEAEAEPEEAAVAGRGTIRTGTNVGAGPFDAGRSRLR